MTFQAAGGVQEREVRRRADPAKAAVERFIRKWRGQTLVMGEPSYGALVGASSRVTRVHTLSPVLTAPRSSAQRRYAFLGISISATDRELR